MASIQQREITSFFKAAGKKRKIVDSTSFKIVGSTPFKIVGSTPFKIVDSTPFKIVDSTPLITQEISEVINSSQF